MRQTEIYIDRSRVRTKSFDTLFCLLMIQFVIFPKNYMVLKAVTLALLIFDGLIMQQGRIRFGRDSIYLGIYIVFNIIFMALGILRGFGKNAIRVSTVYIIWPSVYLLFSGFYVQEEQLKNLFNLLIYLAAIICIIDTVVILSNMFHLGKVLSLLNDLHLGGYLSTSGLFSFRSEHIFFYAFFAPFMISCMFMKKHEIEETGGNRQFIIIVGICSTVISIIIGMGAIWLAVFFGGLLSFFRSKLIKRKKGFLVLLTCTVALFFIAIYSFYRHGVVYSIVEEIGSRFNRNIPYDDDVIRSNQIQAMIETWAHFPLFGKGLGSSVGYYRLGRFVEQSQNEMTYFALLYQCGIVGVLMFLIIAVRSVKSLRKHTGAKWLTEPFATGLICFLIANTFNPYLSNMSTLWILFLPFIIGNDDALR